MTKPPQRPAKPNPSPFRRYGAAASGVLAATCVPGHSEAAVIYTDVDDMMANPDESIFFNLVSGEAEVLATPSGSKSTPTPTITTDFSTWRIANYFDGYDSVFIEEFDTGKKATTKKTAGNATIAAGSPPGPRVGMLLAGESIDGSRFPGVDPYLDASDDGNWDGGGTGFIGLRLIDPASGPDLFGWARITYDDSNDQLTLHDFAYEDSGAAIAAGAGAVVPEPSSVTLLAMGAAGLGLLRSQGRRKNRAAGDG